MYEEMQVRSRWPWPILEARREEVRVSWKSSRHGRGDAQPRDWILGEPSLADFGVYGSLSPLLTVGETIPNDFPRLAKWVRCIQGLLRELVGHLGSASRARVNW